jgi:aspartate/methionine/tyrosine aminotransferase
LITASGVQALNVSIRCAIDPGDEAIILSPNWPNGTEIVRMFGGAPREVPYISGTQRFTIDFAALEAALTSKTRLLLYTSPSNPLGWVATIEEQQQLLDFCRRHQLWLLADEVYERIYFEGPVAPSILRLCRRDDAVIVVQSFSKSYCMTGWRLGWVVSREDLINKAAQLNEFIVSHAPSMIQRAGETALQYGEDDIQAMVEELHEKVTYCYEVLSSIKSISIPKPQGSFYLFPRINGLDDSFSFAVSLLKQHKVAVAPGVAFGNGGEGAVRISCATDRAILEPAMERFRRFVEAGAL